VTGQGERRSPDRGPARRQRALVTAKIVQVEHIMVIGAHVVIDGPLFVACSDRHTAEKVAALLDQHGWVKVPDTVEELLR